MPAYKLDNGKSDTAKSGKQRHKKATTIIKASICRCHKVTRPFTLFIRVA